MFVDIMKDTVSEAIAATLLFFIGLFVFAAIVHILTA